MASREAKRCAMAKKILKMSRFRRNAALQNPSFLEFLGRRLGVAARDVAGFVADNAVDISRFLFEFFTRVPILDPPAPIIPLPGFRNEIFRNDIGRPDPVIRNRPDISRFNQARTGTKTKLSKPIPGLAERGRQAIDRRTPAAPPRSQDPDTLAELRARVRQTPGAPPRSQDPVMMTGGRRITQRATPGAPPPSQDPKLLRRTPDSILSRKPVTGGGSNIEEPPRTGRRQTGRRVTRPQDTVGRISGLTDRIIL